MQQSPLISYIYSIRNIVYNITLAKPNFININCASISLASRGSQTIIIYLIKNPIGLPTQNFSTYATNSVSLVSTQTSGSVTGTALSSIGSVTANINNIIASYVLPESSTLNVIFDSPIIIYPGEILTVGASQISTTAPTAFTFSINVKEDN